MPDSSAKGPYLSKLDGIRCIAVSAVLVHHFASWFSTHIDWGYFGVDLFFVLSGFLITKILISTTEPFGPTYRSFFFRRALRIFPIYYLAVGIFLLLGDSPTRETSVYLLTYTWNYAMPFADVDSPFVHTWSLGVEEQFYLIWPLIAIGLRKRPYALVVVTLLLVGFAYMQIYFNIVETLAPYNYTGLPARMGSLGLGALAAISFVYAPLSNRLMNSRILEVLVGVLWIYSVVAREPFLMGLCSMFVVYKAASDQITLPRVGAVLDCWPIRYVGRISYGIYLYHIPVAYVLTPYFFDPVWKSVPWTEFGSLSVFQYHSWLVKFPLYTSITICLAAASYRFVESPILTLKDRYFSYDSSAKREAQ